MILDFQMFSQKSQRSKRKSQEEHYSINGLTNEEIHHPPLILLLVQQQEKLSFQKQMGNTRPSLE